MTSKCTSQIWIKLGDTMDIVMNTQNSYGMKRNNSKYNKTFFMCLRSVFNILFSTKVKMIYFWFGVACPSIYEALKLKPVIVNGHVNVWLCDSY